MRRVLWIVLCLSMMIGCEKSKVEILQKRLDNFRNILPSELRHQFDYKNYDLVTEGINSLLQNDLSFKTEYDQLKHEELIDVFSPQEVVDFFREYFVEEIERLKQERKRNW